MTYVHERPQKLDKKKKIVGAALPATYLPPPEVLAHCKGNCDILGAGFLLPTVISAELSKTLALLPTWPMDGGGRDQRQGNSLCHLLKLDPGLTSRETSFPQESLAGAQEWGGVRLGCGGVSVSSSFRVVSSKGWGWGRQRKNTVQS